MDELTSQIGEARMNIAATMEVADIVEDVIANLCFWLANMPVVFDLADTPQVDVILE